MRPPLRLRAGTGMTLVPARLDHLRPGLDAQALRETARTLLAQADRLDGRTSRVAFGAALSGLCGVCGQQVTGESCSDCAGVRA